MPCIKSNSPASSIPAAQAPRGNQVEHKKVPHMVKSSCSEAAVCLLWGYRLLKGPAGTWKKPSALLHLSVCSGSPLESVGRRTWPAILDFSLYPASLPPAFQLVLYPIEHLVFHCWLIKFLHLATLSPWNTKGAAWAQVQVHVRKEEGEMETDCLSNLHSLVN